MSPDQRLPPPFYSRQELARWAEELSRSFADRYVSLHKDDGASLESYAPNIDFIQSQCVGPILGIELQEGADLWEEEGVPLLGRTRCELGQLVSAIDRRIDRSHPQFTFTYNHEVMGHGVLHGQWLQRTEPASLLTPEEGIHPDTTDRLERDANFFGSRVAAPRWLLKIVMAQAFGDKLPYYRGPAVYSLCPHDATFKRDCDSYAELCTAVANLIRNRFGGLSAEALSYRLADERLVLNQARRPGPTLYRTATGHHMNLRRPHITFFGSRPALLVG